MSKQLASGFRPQPEHPLRLNIRRDGLAEATGWSPDQSHALAPSLSAAPADRIIVALDGMAPEQALHFAAQVDGLRWVKVGLELFVQAGPEVVAQLREQGLRVFLDLKFHDIPATMAGACRRAAALGAELITVHACAGSEALKAAQAAAEEGAQGCLLYTSPSPRDPKTSRMPSSA